MTKGLVISLCDLTGNMVRPWAENGYECICYDLQHSIRNDRVETLDGGGEITFRWGNVLSLTPEDFPSKPVIIFSFPPCTDLSVSGARDFQRKGLRLFIDALEVVERCRLISQMAGCVWMLENPVSRLSSSWRKPDYYFDPCDYGKGFEETDAYQKTTCLWTSDDFVMPESDPVPVTMESYIHKMPPSKERANLRSATPMGFSNAVFRYNRIDQ